MHITPKVAEALRAFAASPTRELIRCSGGYRAALPFGHCAPGR